MNNAIYYFLAYLIEGIIFWQYTSNLFPSVNNDLRAPHTRKWLETRKIIALILLYLFLFSISVIEIKWLNAVLFFLANYIYLLTQYQLKSILSLFHSSILTAIMGMCELISYYIILYYSPNFFVKPSHPQSLAIFGIFSKTLYLLIVYILIYFLKGKNTHNTSQNLFALLLSFIPITSVFVMLLFISIGENVTLSHSTSQMIALTAVLLLCINLLVFSLNCYIQKKHSEYTETLLLLQKESDTAKYYEMLLTQHDNQSILIHDIKKHLQSIALLNDQRDHEKISAYIKQLLLSSDLKESTRVCDHALLNAILCRYKKQCLSLQISFLTDIRSGTVNFMADNDVTSLFCNLLDNAVEACTGIPGASIEMTVQKKENTPFVVITMINSCRSNPFSEQPSFQRRMPFTSKPDKRKHGFGIKSIRKAVGKYNGDIKMYYKDDAAAFHTIISLKHAAV